MVCICFPSPCTSEFWAGDGSGEGLGKDATCCTPGTLERWHANDVHSLKLSMVWGLKAACEGRKKSSSNISNHSIFFVDVCSGQNFYAKMKKVINKLELLFYFFLHYFYKNRFFFNFCFEGSGLCHWSSSMRRLHSRMSAPWLYFAACCCMKLARLHGLLLLH